jgi:hypothetical protein
MTPFNNICQNISVIMNELKVFFLREHNRTPNPLVEEHFDREKYIPLGREETREKVITPTSQKHYVRQMHVPVIEEIRQKNAKSSIPAVGETFVREMFFDKWIWRSIMFSTNRNGSIGEKMSLSWKIYYFLSFPNLGLFIVLSICTVTEVRLGFLNSCVNDDIELFQCCVIL